MIVAFETVDANMPKPMYEFAAETVLNVDESDLKYPSCKYSSPVVGQLPPTMLVTPVAARVLLLVRELELILVDVRVKP